MPGKWQAEFARLFPDARFNEPLSRHTTFRIGGPADAYLVIDSVDALARAYRFARKRRLPVFPLGWGSNLLVLDGGIRGLVLRLRGDFEKVRFGPGETPFGFPLKERQLWAGCGVRLPQLVVKCAERGLAGSEPLVGVPGTVGGALVMNAGTRDGEIGEFVRCVDVFDPKTLSPARITRGRLRFAYRRSNLKNRFVLGGTLELNPGDKDVIIKRVRKFQQIRLKTQPVHSYNVGSIFKNPPGHFVAKLIQEAGLKGKANGGARVSPLHANFIENASRASARDVLDLVDIIRGKVLSRTGIDLKLEMKVVGEPGEASPHPA